MPSDNGERDGARIEKLYNTSNGAAGPVHACVEKVDARLLRRLADRDCRWRVRLVRGKRNYRRVSRTCTRTRSGTRAAIISPTKAPTCAPFRIISATAIPSTPCSIRGSPGSGLRGCGNECRTGRDGSARGDVILQQLGEGTLCAAAGNAEIHANVRRPAQARPFTIEPRNSPPGPLNSLSWSLPMR